MKLLTIGEFARAARLSPKALRLYDELGLLRPFRVDARAGYRYLLCSDGLTSVVPVAAIRETLSAAVLPPEEVVRRLSTDGARRFLLLSTAAARRLDLGPFRAAPVT